MEIIARIKIKKKHEERERERDIKGKAKIDICDKIVDNLLLSINLILYSTERYVFNAF